MVRAMVELCGSWENPVSISFLALSGRWKYLPAGSSTAQAVPRIKRGSLTRARPHNPPRRAPAGGHGPRQPHAGRVGGLKDVLLVHAPRDFADEDGGEPLGPQLLVHAQKVDLHEVLVPA